MIEVRWVHLAMLARVEGSPPEGRLRSSLALARRSLAPQIFWHSFIIKLLKGGLISEEKVI